MLHFAEYGKGEPIVLIHGFCENSTCFSKQVFFLSQRFRVVCIDLPGHGSSVEQTLFTLDDLALQVKQVVDQLSISRFVMLGHSMGGYLTLAFAKRFPSSLAGWGLINATAKADTEERKLKREQAISVINEKGAPFYIQQFIPPLFHNPQHPEIAVRQASNTSISAASLVACLTAMKNREELTALIPSSPVPLGFWIGKHDAIIPSVSLFEQAALAQIAQITNMEHTAHMSMLEEPDKLSHTIASFADLCYNYPFV